MAEQEAGETGVSGADGATFRQAMSRLSQQVHVITGIGAKGRCGVTVTAVASVSDDPPTVLFCLNRSSRTFPLFEDAKVFCINTLAGEHVPVADAFAGRGNLDTDARFALADWTTMETGAPVLKAALASFDCRVSQVIDMATHRIFFGVVEATTNGADTARALTYYNRGYVVC
ncbi:flavin reductase/cob(II)yrinic acid a,c-diamide reductase [Breoghania corrubedonensis]|uniref:Flavin reductase/cob(II)yrinic acid a,c-diamide reductase n=1 Tax=Breoghania corrubedonensis TaxID=665038 RepID=A0A2T5VDB0_9HYPH|nr:flavin reductase [Breoghania corrubedonensis]PTW61725.1 flavin reductase/cob(II)yrinic acid a,c-diamide reductase [Breoghania corrubedonensis]